MPTMGEVMTFKEKSTIDPRKQEILKKEVPQYIPAAVGFLTNVEARENEI